MSHAAVWIDREVAEVLDLIQQYPKGSIEVIEDILDVKKIILKEQPI